MDLEKLKKDELNDFAAVHFPDIKIKSDMKHAEMVKVIRKELKNQDLKEEDFKFEDDVAAKDDAAVEEVSDGIKCDRCGSLMKLIESKDKGYAKYKEYICDGPQSEKRCGKKITVM